MIQGTGTKEELMTEITKVVWKWMNRGFWFGYTLGFVAGCVGMWWVLR